MTLKKLKFIPGRTESTMRRMLDPPFTTCKYFLHYGSAMQILFTLWKCYA